MKKTIAWILCFASLFTLFACGKPQEEEPAKEIIVDYDGTSLADWMYQPEAEDETTRRLITIDTCQYGTAGSSLRQMHATVALFWLCIAEDREEKLDAYLEPMTDTQRDFFSFQWQTRVAHAKQCKENPELASGLMSDSGIRDVTLDFFRIEDVEEFDAVVLEKLKDYGVADAWKTTWTRLPSPSGARAYKNKEQ